MMQESGISILLDHSEKSLPLAPSGVVTVLLDEVEEATRKFSSENLPTRVSPANLAYIIFTSGSTGLPKGSLLTHFNAVRLFQATQELFDFNEHDSWSLFHSLAFDFSVWEYWGALITGGRFVLVPLRVRHSAEEFYELIAAEQITILNQTPSFFRQLVSVDAALDKRVLPLRHIIFGGEALDVPGLKPWFDRYGDACPRLTNMYGITETTVHVTLRPISASDCEESIRSPLGMSIQDLEMFVVDEHFNLVPSGVAGELFVAGDGLARGYLNRPDLTAERFLPHPYSSQLGARWYRTGDAARQSRGNEAEYLGRKDRQVKIRGFRIELGEIEAVLKQHPKIKDCVVLVHEDETGGQKLAAYFVANQDLDQSQESSAPRLREWQSVFDEIYNGPSRAYEALFNTAGWNSSYTNQPISAEEMQDWVDTTVARVLGLSPENVLEIGCGTGLLLFRIAPQCRKYVGRDFSRRALEQVEESGLLASLLQVRLQQAEADDFTGLEEEQFDTIILNSVVQYFPDIHYLVRVLEKAVKFLAPGGRIFLGDIRNLHWLEAFYASVVQATAGPLMDVSSFCNTIRRNLEQERELVISPAFFEALRQYLPQISSVELLLKRGRRRNEMTRFRYDVVLHLGENRVQEDYAVIDWRQQKLTPARLRAEISAHAGEFMLVKNIENVRVIEELNLLDVLEGADRQAAVADLRSKAVKRQVEGMDPEEACRLGEELACAAVPCLSTASPECYEVWYRPRFQPSVRPRREESSEPAMVVRGKLTWEQYTNAAQQRRSSGALVPELRSYVQQKLPEYMRPALWIPMNTMPLTRNGKLDIKNLPQPETSATELSGSFAAPRSETEQLLARIWEEVLNISGIGITHDFFTELGGHSLLATQVISRVREVFQSEIPLRSLFERPTVEGLAQEIDRRLRAGNVKDLPVVARSRREEPVPLSYAQERLWFLDQIGVGEWAYHITLAVRLWGVLQIDAMRSALEDLTTRHETLRTHFQVVDGLPWQVIDGASPVDFPLWDLSDRPEPVREEECRTIRRSENRKKFDLARGEVWRVGLVRLAEQEHVLFAVLHHIVADGWSLGVIVKEIGELYEARVEGRPAELEPRPIQYADYTLWQREALVGDELERQSEYWRRQLLGTARTELPSDHPRRAKRDHKAGRIIKKLEPALNDGIRSIAGECDVTVFMFFLGMLEVLLWRYTREDDIVVGTVIANRNRKEIEKLIGFFVNTLVLRADLSGDPTLGELFKQVREVTLGAYAHQDLPFEKLVEELQPERELARSPLFSVMLVMQNAPFGVLELKDLEATIEEGAVEAAKFDLVVTVGERNNQFIITLDYDAELFEVDTIERIGTHYENLIKNAQAGRHLHLSELQMTEEDPRELLVMRERAALPAPSLASFQELFEEQVRRTPNSMAVTLGEDCMSYAELNRRGNQSAHYLAGLGVKSEMPVGICIERSLDEIVALLGILKSGAAFVPLDPTSPPERLTRLIHDCGLRYVVTRSELAASMSGAVRLVTICLDSDLPKIARQESNNPNIRVSGESLAYILYTSGSTGEPKGVMIEQRSLVNYLAWVNASLLRDVDCVPAISKLGFDAALKQLLAPLIIGKSVWLIRDIARDPASLMRMLESGCSMGINCVPALWRVLLKEITGGELKGIGPHLNRLLLGGESLPPELVRQTLDALPHLEITNLYGPTEATANATCALSVGPENISLGNPIFNVQIYVLNQQLQPMPPGSVGELYIGGLGLARGYCGKPAVTAQCFLPNPLSHQPGERLYRTGDLVRYRQDGTLEYVGRTDRQVKVRGNRIELSEIEAALKLHERVKDCVVVMHEKEADRRLVAYVVWQGVEEPGMKQLRDHVRARLPEYMTPSIWVNLPALPLNSHGKLDLRALPSPDDAGIDLHSAYVAPRNAIEEFLAGIWEEVLGMENIGMEHNFFSDLGGHSLLASQVMARMREAMQAEVPLRMLFENPTIAMLATRMMESEHLKPHLARVTDTYRELMNLSDQEAQLLLEEN